MSTVAGRLAAATQAPLIVEADETTWRTLWVLCAYRVVLALFVAMAFVYLNRFFNFGIVTPQAVVPTVGSYIAASVALLIPARLREPSLMLQVTAGSSKRLDGFADLGMRFGQGSRGGCRLWRWR